jgi:hypothetical protein
MNNATIHKALIDSRIDDLRRTYNPQRAAYVHAASGGSHDTHKQRRHRNRAVPLRLFARFAH